MTVLLKSNDPDFRDGIKFSGFCWRWKKRNNESFRVLTIEGNKYKKIDGYEETIVPCNLSSKDPNFTLEITKDAFNWRIIECNSGNYRVVTIEQGNDKIETDFLVECQDLFWTDDAINDHDYIFNWRWITRNGQNFKIVTLEENNIVKQI